MNSDRLTSNQQPITNNQQLITNIFNSLVAVEGRICFPCVPSMVEECLQAIANLVASFGMPLSREDKDCLREGMAELINKGFANSPLSQLIVEYCPNEPPETGLCFDIKTVSPSFEVGYQNWLKRRREWNDRPDRKIIAIVSSLEKPASILEVGGGRNGLALGRSGYRVEIVELVPEFVEELQEISKKEELFVSVKAGNLLDPMLRVRPAAFDLAIASDFIPVCCRNSEDIRLLLAKLCDGVKSGGLMILGAFLALEGYEPCDRVQELSQVRGCYLLTRSQLQEAMTDLPLKLLSDESFLEGDNHLPEGLKNWASGKDLFLVQAESLIEFRWILCQRI
ncbi:MAG: class I SAM-dependent methyltransferase [Spirulina sp.]